MAAPLSWFLQSQRYFNFIRIPSKRCLQSYPVYERHFLFPKKETTDFIFDVPERVKSFKERMDELNPKDPELDKPVYIGLPEPSWWATQEKDKDELQKYREDRRNAKLEQSARLRKLKVPLDEVKKKWLRMEGPLHIRTIAEHYGIFNDLFGKAIFTPWVHLKVHFDYSEDLINNVYWGNVIPPSEVSKAPTVEYEADENSLWTLILTTPDGHLQDNSAEYLHWFIGNIPGSCISKGEVVCSYLQPFPPRGTGFHRFVFILYRQEQHINFEKEKRPSSCFSLKARTFKTLDFYKEHQNALTPAGLSFFQSDWDASVTSVYHNQLEMREPIFEYIHKEIYIVPDQKCHPHKEPFNLYLNRYRDPKEMNQEILMKRFQMISPFAPEPPLKKYPNIYPIKVSSWEKTELTKERLHQGRYKDLSIMSRI